MSRSLDALIHLHLEGELTTAEAAELSARLASDPAAAKRLAEMAFDQAVLRSALEAKPVRRRFRAALPLAAAALLLVAVGAALWVGPGEKAASPAPAVAPPSSYRGPVKGRVLPRTESGMLRLLVTEGVEHPLAGRTIHVGPGFQRTDAGDVVPHRTHPAFLKRLEPGQDLTIDVREVGEDVFLLGELTPEQADAVKRDLKKTPPKDVKKAVDRGDREGTKVPGSEEGKKTSPPKDGDREQ